MKRKCTEGWLLNARLKLRICQLLHDEVARRKVKGRGFVQDVVNEALDQYLDPKPAPPDTELIGRILRWCRAFDNVDGLIWLQDHWQIFESKQGSPWLAK